MYRPSLYVSIIILLFIAGYLFYTFEIKPKPLPIASLYNTNKDAFGTDNADSNQQQPNIDNTISNNPINNQNNNKKVMKATFHTNKGDIGIEFYNDLTPNTVNNFVTLAKSGFYDGVKFHRVIQDFMIQAGDPNSRDDSKQAEWGRGGPGYTFKDEIGPTNSNAAGTISMANAGPNTNGSQFFINLKDNNFLDGKHTVFGKVVSGLDVVKAIGNVKTGESDRPIDPVIIKSISLE